jgi:hypothetical protein
MELSDQKKEEGHDDSQQSLLAYFPNKLGARKLLPSLSPRTASSRLMDLVPAPTDSRDAKIRHVFLAIQTLSQVVAFSEETQLLLLYVLYLFLI